MPDFTDFIAAARDSLVDAQPGLDGEANASVMAVSEARLEAKVALDSSGEGLSLQTVSLQDMTAGTIETAALSTVQLDFVAVSVEQASGSPTKAPNTVIDELAGRSDVKVLDRIFGGLAYRAEFVASQQKWLVVASSGDTVVREAIIPDVG